MWKKGGWFRSGITTGSEAFAQRAGLFQRRMLYWHRFAPESRMMRRVTDALIDYGHKVLRQD